MNKKSKLNFDEVETIVGPSVKTEGALHSSGNIKIQGILKGEIKTSANLNVEQEAKIEGQIQAKNAIVAGEVRGDLQIEEMLEITEQGKVIGNISVKILSVAPNAIFDGQCKMTEIEEKVEENK